MITVVFDKKLVEINSMAEQGYHNKVLL